MFQIHVMHTTCRMATDRICRIAYFTVGFSVLKKRIDFIHKETIRPHAIILLYISVWYKTVRVGSLAVVEQFITRRFNRRKDVESFHFPPPENHQKINLDERVKNYYFKWIVREYKSRADKIVIFRSRIKSNPRTGILWIIIIVHIILLFSPCTIIYDLIAAINYYYFFSMVYGYHIDDNT